MITKRKNKYAAKLLFQFRTLNSGVSNKKRVCEERIILLMAETPKLALKLVNEKGKEEEFSYNDNGIRVFFEFIGVLELIELAALTDPDEVWSILIEKIKPMENKNKIIPKEDKLKAFCTGMNKNKLTILARTEVKRRRNR